MQKKSLMFVALLLFAGSAHAENETIDFSVSAGESTTMATILMGEPTPLQQSRHEMSSTCTFTTDIAGIPIKTEYSSDTSTGMTTTVLPLERTETGLKAYVTISKLSAQNQDWAVINKDCKLPVGTTNSAGISLIHTFEWGQPTRLKLPDGSVVVVKATQARSAGIN